MKKVLERLMKSKELCEVHGSFEETDAFTVGYVCGVDDDFVFLRLVSPDGKDDGVILKEIDTIAEVDTDTEYLCAVNKLISASGSNMCIDDVKYKNLLKGFLSELKEKQTICTVYFDNLGIFGKIVDIDGEIVKIHKIKRIGDYDGFSYCGIRDITDITAGGDIEVRLGLLHNKRT